MRLWYADLLVAAEGQKYCYEIRVENNIKLIQIVNNFIKIGIDSRYMPNLIFLSHKKYNCIYISLKLC